MNEILRLIQRGKEISASESPVALITKGVDKLRVYATTPFKKMTYAKKTFNFRGRELCYAVHAYNATWRNERAIEVPIMLEFLQGLEKGQLLEVGNVANYYLPFDHDVIDKYENSEGVQNLDFISFNPEKRYSSFMSISTFEHIGWDEPSKDAKKVKEAVFHIYKVVSDIQKVLVTCPLGYNPYLDQFVLEDALPFEEIVYFKRIDSNNNWQQTDKEDALRFKYGQKFPAANSIFVGIGLKPSLKGGI